MKENQQPEPKPQASSPPPRPPRGPTVTTGFGDEDPDPDPKREVFRIPLPPKLSAYPTIELPTLPAGVPAVTKMAPKKTPWWKFWK